MGVLNQKPPMMRPLWTSVALLLASLLHVEGYTCPSGKSKETITLGVGESVDFSTQETDTYGKNVKCVVKFKRGKRSKCKLNFSCSAFTLTAKNSNCNKGSDFMKIGKEKFCEDNSPDVTVNGRTLNVLFRSNKKSKGGSGAKCTASCIDTSAPATTTTAAPATTAAPTTTGGSVTSGPGVTVPNVPNPGSDGGTFEVTIVQSWSQETNYARVTQVQVPPTTAGQKVPMVIDLHGNGGQGNLRRLSYLADGAVIVAPNGYERSWNVNNEGSKADDVSFILELISKVAEAHPAADANNVNLVGTSNGAAIIYRLLIATGIDRPFHRVFPMVSSIYPCNGGMVPSGSRQTPCPTTTPSRQSPSFPMTLSTTTSMELTMGPLPTKGNAQDLLSWEQTFALYLLSRRTFCSLKQWATRVSRSQTATELRSQRTLWSTATSTAG